MRGLRVLDIGSKGYVVSRTCSTNGRIGVREWGERRDLGDTGCRRGNMDVSE